MISEFTLALVEYMPMSLEPGVLYVSKKYQVAGHLCPCGCGNKIITPLTPTEWVYTEIKGKPTLKPSIGNWQLPCRSHYWIRQGKVEWSYQWTDKEIELGRKREEKERKKYYKKKKRGGKVEALFSRIREWWS